MPRLSPQIECLKESDILNYNYTGAYKINQQRPLVPFLHIQDWQNKHQLQIYNPRILEAVNMAQSCGFLINKEQFDWFFSSKNPEYKSENDYILASDAKRTAIVKQTEKAKRRNAIYSEKK